MSNLQLKIANETSASIDFSRIINGMDLDRSQKRRALEHRRERRWLADALEDVLCDTVDDLALEDLIEGNS